MAPRLVASFVVLALALTSCGDDAGSAAATDPTTTLASGTTETTVEPVGGLVAEIGTNRLYAVHRGLGLALENVTDAPIVVRSMQLDTPQFEVLPPTRREVTLTPDRRLVLALPYGEVRCEEPAGLTFAVEVVLDGGEELHLDAVEEYEGAVARLHARECAAADVHERVAITFGDEWEQHGVETTGVLQMAQRHPGEPVAIDDAVGNVIFTLHTEDAHPVLEVSDAEPSAEVPVTISADRCDPHAVAEFKTPYLFLSWVAVGDGEPVPVPLELTGGARQALVDLIATCST